MRDHIVEIIHDGRYLSLYRGFLTISSQGSTHGQIPLDDLQALICSAKGISISIPVLAELAKRGIPVVISGEKYLPQAIVWPLDGNHQTARRIRMQIETPIPLRKRLWQKIIQLKLNAQAEVLKLQKNEKESALIRKMIRKVLSGDSANTEAVAASLYFRTLFGSEFSRDDTERFPINTFFNYGYSIVRSAVARSIAAAGLHPAIGFHHHNRFNPFCLVDDLMEPFRPIVDQMVLNLYSDETELSKEAKKILASVLRMDMRMEEGRSPLNVCIQKFVTSIAISLEEKKMLLRLPLSPLPLDQEPICSEDIESCG